MPDYTARFADFCRNLQIDSKEHGELIPLVLYGGQRYLVDEIASAIEGDQRLIVVLKCRQMGASTVTMAWDLFWMLMHNLQAALITDTDTNREYFRATLKNYLASLPKSMNARVGMHNRNQLELVNPARGHRTRMVYLTAGMRSTGTLGKGKAINYLHGTETATWGGGADLDSLMSTLAESNPNRLYIFESTAYGFGPFRELYYNAKRALSQKAIFVTWWRSPEIYSCRKDSAQYKVYGGAYKGEERLWAHEVKRLYGHQITPEQIAWWRYTLAEKFHANESSALQEFPWFEEQAFQMSGANFFDFRKLTQIKRECENFAYDNYSYSFGFKFEETTLVKATPRTSMLKIWEYPRKDAFYVLGADPAYGSSDNADQFAIAIYRCYGNIMIQVAEFAAQNLTTMQFSWVLGHLAGYYRNTFVNLEVQGPGEAVLNELNHMRDYSYYDIDTPQDITNIIGNIGQYVYRRPDSFGGATAWHWKTTGSTKPRMMNYFRSAIAADQIVIKSDDLIEEMRYVSQDGASIEAASGEHDDLVIASALACVAWKESIQMYLLSQRKIWSPETDVLNKDGEEDKNVIVHGLLDSMLGAEWRELQAGKN